MQTRDAIHLGTLAFMVSLMGCSHGSLAQGGKVAGDLVGGRPAVLELQVAAGRAITLLVWQVQGDLAFTVTPSNGAAAWTIDMRERGPESVTLLGGDDTRFSVSISARDLTQTARYEAALDGAAHVTSDRDRQRADAERLETLGKTLMADPRGSRPDAERALRAAATLWQTTGDAIGQGTTAARLGDIQFALGRFETAVETYAEAKRTLRAAGMSHQVAILDINLGATHEQRGDYVQARRHFQEAIGALAQLPGTETDRAVAMANQGTMYLRFGNYQSALAAYLTALPVLEAHRRLNPAILNNLGMLHRTLGDVDAAERYFQRALDSLPVGHPRRIDLRIRTAQIALDRDDAASASAGATEALLLVRNSPAADPIVEGDALALQGEAYAAAARYTEALTSHKASLARYEAAGARRSIASAWHRIGSVRRRLGHSAQARRALGRALQYRTTVGLRDAEAETRYELGMLEVEAGRLDQADVEFSSAINLIEGVRSRVVGDYSRTSYLASRDRYFAAYVDVLMRRHDQRPREGFAARALEVTERKRARALVDLVEDSSIGGGGDSPGGERRRLAQRDLDFWAGQVARLSNQKDIDAEKAARGKVADALVRIREAEAAIGGAGSDHTRTPGPALDLREIQRRLLDRRTRFVSFALGPRRSFVWVVSADSVHVAVLPDMAEIVAAADAVNASLRARDSTEVFTRLTGALGRLILQPIQHQLGAERLLISADGSLHTVPFGALPDRPGGAPLVERHEIAMVPSAGAVLANRERRANRPAATGSLAVVADAVYEIDDPRVFRRARADATQGTFGRLMLAKTEADWILRQTDGRGVYRALGFDATREAVLRDLGDYRVVHLAAHAVADDTWPESSGVALSMFDRRGVPQMGMLRLSEISTALRLRADVVVLSACDTVAGRRMAGEGIMGLARGFLGAGATSVIGALSSVLEEPTFEFMKLLYSEMLSRGQPPVTALRAAQLAMRRHPRFAEPYYWSAFVFIGDPG